ncbi:MAG: MFS transporter [Candidatus Bathyarchaeia archaeon]|jgi:DHA3 family macrolide efflux protein-like MFS transporter
MEKPTDSTFRSYLFFFGGQVASTLGSSIVQFVIIWWITLQTQSGAYLALASFAGLVPTILLSPLIGVLVDRWNRKALIALADFSQAIATLALIVLFWGGAASVFNVFVILAVRGLCQAVHSPTVLAVTPSMVPQEKLGRINGLSFFFTGAVNLAGPVLAALLLAFGTIDQILWVDIVTFATAIVPVLAVKIPSAVTVTQKGASFKASFKEGLSHIRNHKGLMPLFLLAMILNLLVTPLTTLLPYFVRFDHLGGAGDLALVEALIEGGILAGGLAMTAIGAVKKKSVAMTASFYAIFAGYLLVSLSPTGAFWFMGLAGLAAAFFIPVINVLAATITQTFVPLEMQGRVNSVNLALVTAAMPIGMVISGVAVELINTSTLFLGCALTGFLAVTVIWLFTSFRHVEKTQNGVI